MPSFVRNLADRLLGVAARGAHALLKSVWFVRRPKTYGAHAVALTPEDRLILVRLRYSPGWRLPGGGRKADEDPRDAALRELREEIGMTAHGEVKFAGELEESVDFKRDTASLVVVRDVEYAPRWSWEVEAITEALIDELPEGLSPITARWLQSVRPWL
ncbi:MAG TPA: NUDIX domain-containing protein [Sphingomicrobium sp.]|nr:NUDIX domain-containing protein [Sphingomicrobium sp.]